MNHTNTAQAFAALLLPVVSISCWIACGAYDYELLHAAVGMSAFTIVAVPMLLQPRIDWFSPWSFVIVSVGIGCGARGVCMSLAWPDAYDIDYFFLLGKEPAFFVVPYAYLLFGLICLTLGYFSQQFPHIKRRHLAKSLRWNIPRLNFVLATVVIIAAFATLQYIRNTGGFNSAVISGKRTVIYDIDIQGDSEFNQYGYLRQLAKLANFAYLTLLGYTLFYVRRISAIRTAILTVLLFVACAFPFYSSSRLPIMWTFVGSAALLWYSGRAIQIGKLAAIGVVGLLVFYGMTEIRGKSDVRQQIGDSGILGSLVDGLVIHRNFMGLSKTAHIINSIPSELNYEYGRTIAVWAVSPIPRRIWPNKPMVHTGPIIGNRVYGNNVSGVPPGMFAELFWNFHVAGVVLGSLALGILLRFVGEVFRPRPGHDLPLALIYVIGPMRLGFEMAGNSVGFGLMKVIVDSASMALVLLLVLDHQRVIAPTAKTQATGSPRSARKIAA